MYKIRDGPSVSNGSFACHVSEGILHILIQSECVERLNQELAGWSTVAWRELHNGINLPAAYTASEHGPDWTEKKTETVLQLSVFLFLSIFTGTKAL